MRYLFAIAALLIACASPAQQGAWEKAFIWQVEKGDHKLYLLGGLSVGKETFYPMPKSVGNAVRDSDVLVLETDIEDDKASQRALSLGMYDPPDSLEQNLPSDLYEAITAEALNHDVAESQLRAMRPWMLYFQIIFKEFADAGHQSRFSTSSIIYGLAKSLNKEVVAMEPADAASQYLNTLSPALQEAMLRGLLVELKHGAAAKSLDELWRTMRAGDAQAFMAAVDANEQFYPKASELREKLFYARHTEMLKKIEDYLATNKKHLVVLGAVNLLGERGLVEALRKKGYQVKQL